MGRISAFGVWELARGENGKIWNPCMIGDIWADINTVLTRSWTGIRVWQFGLGWGVGSTQHISMTLSKGFELEVLSLGLLAR
jgi:hypothetical protein